MIVLLKLVYGWIVAKEKYKCFITKYRDRHEKMPSKCEITSPKLPGNKLKFSQKMSIWQWRNYCVNGYFMKKMSIYLMTFSFFINCHRRFDIIFSEKIDRTHTCMWSD